MDATVKEVLEFVKENDVKFIRLAFCDMLGRQKNISIMPDELQEAFINGISFDAHAICGFTDITKSDLFLVPDPSTLSILPWRPQQGRVVRFYCDIKNPDGSPFIGDTRSILKSTMQKCSDMGYDCKIGAECEFYLFKTDENGEPVTVPYDNGSYLDVAPLDKGENVRREICLCLEEMGIRPESSHHEQGPGQNEIDFKFSDALNSADNFVTFKNVVRTISARNGLFASFSPKPLQNNSGSGLHINISLSSDGHNIFKQGDSNHSEIAHSFIAGVLSKAKEISLFLNPIPNSYDRFGAYEAPKYVSWSVDNRSQLVRIPSAKGEKARMELRSPDPSANPYLAFALVIRAGLDGVEKKIKLPESVDVDLYEAARAVTATLDKLPKDMDEAILLAENSAFVKEVVGEETLNKFLNLKKSECQEFSNAYDKRDYYLDNYFKMI